MKSIRLLHPILFSVLPVVILYAGNSNRLFVSDVTRSLIVLPFVALLLVFIGRHLFKQADKAAIWATLTLLVNFSYWHIAKLLPDFTVAVSESFSIGRDKLLFPMFLIGYLGITVTLVRRKMELSRWSFNITRVLSALLVANLAYIAFYIVLTKSHTANELIEVKRNLTADNQAALPDIYYIILDAYGRDDVLREYYGYDNQSFLSYLEGNGFYIGHQSQTNYAQTALSLASTLNMTYLDDLTSSFGESETDRKVLREMILNNKTMSKLKQAGYTTVAFSTGFDMTELPSRVDIYYHSTLGLNYFESSLLSTTLLGKGLSLVQQNLYEVARNRFKYNLARLSEVPEIDAPTFTFLHVLQPHPPFIFDAQGNPIKQVRRFHLGDGDEYPGSTSEYKQGYLEQSKFVTSQVQLALTEILTKSPSPPMIIIQSDHGPGMMLKWEKPQETNFYERMSILNAYLVPPQVKDRLYPSISPVNTFRLLFDEVFQNDHELLEDRSYFSTRSKPYKFYPVVNYALDNLR